MPAPRPPTGPVNPPSHPPTHQVEPLTLDSDAHKLPHTPHMLCLRVQQLDHLLLLLMEHNAAHAPRPLTCPSTPPGKDTTSRTAAGPAAAAAAAAAAACCSQPLDCGYISPLSAQWKKTASVLQGPAWRRLCYCCCRHDRRHRCCCCCLACSSLSQVSAPQEGRGRTARGAAGPLLPLAVLWGLVSAGMTESPGNPRLLKARGGVGWSAWAAAARTCSAARHGTAAATHLQAKLQQTEDTKLQRLST